MDQQNPIEQYLQQLRAMGLTEEAVEMYRKQMEQSIQMANNWAGQFLQEQGNEDPELPSEILLNKDSQLDKEQQWAVACGADVAFTNGQYLNDLTTGLGKQVCRQLLSDWWDMTARKSWKK